MSQPESVNFEHAQATIQCDHCGEVKDVRHYCLICEETMCSTCKAIHNKARATRDHQVVLREERHTKDQGSPFCEKHPDQKTSLHCDTCNVPVCTKCKAETDNGHKFSEMSIILQNLKRKIEESKEKMEIRMRDVDALIQKSEQSWEDYENIVKTIESSISDDTEAFHSHVDKMAQERKDELNHMRHQDRAAWETAKGRLDGERTKISTCLEQHDKCLNSTTTTDMAELLDESRVVRSKLLDAIEVVPPSYQSPSNTSSEGLGEITRQCKGPSMIESSNLKVVAAEVISSFSSTIMGEPSICYAGNGRVLLGTTHSMYIHIINIHGDILQKKEKAMKNKCRSIAVMACGDIIVSPEEKDNIYILNGQNKLMPLFDTSSLNAKFISVTEKQEILVCLTFRGQSRVILCDSKGGNQRHIGSDDLFKCPIQAIALQDGGFCISDSGRERLVMLNADGKIKHIIEYPLEKVIFWPWGICIDKAGNIMATDGYNDCVYVVGKDMSVRKKLVGKTEGIRKPRCLCVDDDNNLWIAQDNGEIKVVKYLDVQ